MATNCPACGAQQKEENPRFCASCGANMTGGGAKPPHRDDERVLFEGSPAMVRSLGALCVAILTLGLACIYFWLKARATHYKITTQRIVIEEGIFSKRLEQVDLYRVMDYVVVRPFGQRLLGTGNLIVQSADRTTAEVQIQGIRTDVRELYEQLRDATEIDKRSRNVRVVDYE